MVRSENPVFIRLSDGRVLGKPKRRRRPAAARARPPSSAATRTASASPTAASRVGHRAAAVGRPRRRLGDGQPPPHRASAGRRSTGRRPGGAPASGSGRRTAGQRPAPAPRRHRPAAGGPSPSPPPAAPARARAAARRPGRRRLRGAVVVLAFVLSLFGGRLVQLQGLDAPTYAAEAGAGPAAHRDAAGGARHDHRPQRRARWPPRSHAVNVTVDQTLVSDPAADGRRAGPGARDRRRGRCGQKLTGDRALRLRREDRSRRRPGTRSRRSTTSTRRRPGCPASSASRPRKRVYPRGDGRAPTSSASSARTARGSAASSTRWTRPLAGRDGTATYELGAGGRRIPSGVDTERDAGARHATCGSPSTATSSGWRRRRCAKAVASSRRAERHRHRARPAAPVTCWRWRPRRRFDPNDPGAAPAADRGNRPLTEAYEPGSTGKVMTAAALIEEGVDHADDADHGAQPAAAAPDKCFKDFDEHGDRAPDLRRDLAKSSNIGTILAAERLGNLKRLYPYLTKFGIGQPTGLGLPGETAGDLPQAGRLVGHQRLHDGLRPGLLGQHGADGLGLRDHRQRRRARGAAPGRGHDRRRRHGARRRRPPRRTRVVSAATAADRAADAGGGRRPGRRHRAARPRSPATGSPARPAPRSASTRPAAATAATRCRSSGWRPADEPGLVVAVTLQTPRSAIGGGVQRRPGVPARSCRFALRVAAHPADRHQGPPGSSSPRTDR